MIFWLLACGGEPPPLTLPQGTRWSDPLISTVRKAGIEGFEVEEGRLLAFDEARCEELVEELGHCLGNNPTTPYVTAFFDTYDTPFGINRLRTDQALLFVGRTPPESLYYSLTAAVHERSYADGVDTPVGSISGSLHHRRIRHDGASPFDATTVVIVAANRTVAQQVKRQVRPMLERMGIAADVTNVLEIPYLKGAELLETAADPAYTDVTVAPLRMGVGEEDDGFSFTWRVAGADPDADWFDADAIHQAVFKLSPTEDVDHNPWPYPLLPPVRDSENLPPDALVAGLRTLAARVDADQRARGVQALRLRFEETVFDGFRCIDNGIRCGNSDDALYSGSVRVLLPEGNVDAGVFVVGAIHPDVPDLGSGPRLAYSNLNVQNADEMRALTGWVHTELRGSARELYPGGIDGISADVFDRLYIRHVSRSCSTPECLPLDDLEAGAKLNFLERAYLDLGTGTGPHPAAILEPRVVIYGPEVIPRVLAGFIEVR